MSMTDQDVAAQTATETINEVADSQVDTGLVADDAVETPAEEMATETKVEAPAIPPGYISEEEHRARLEQSRKDTAQSAADRLIQELTPLLEQARRAAPQPVDPIAAELADYAAELAEQVESGILAPETRTSMLRREYRNLQSQAGFQQQAAASNQFVQQQNAQRANDLFVGTLAQHGITPNTPDYVAVETEAHRFFSKFQPGTVTPQDIVDFTGLIATNVKNRSAALKEVKRAGNPMIEPGAPTATAPRSDVIESPPTESLRNFIERVKRDVGLA